MPISRQPNVRLWDLVFALLATAAAFPLWWVDFAPIQDLPQHLAAIRVLHDFNSPVLGFAEFYEIDLLRTQYLAYYLAADLLAHVFDVEIANKLLITAFIIGTPYSMRALLAALGRDPRYALFVLPLTYNAHLILGFLNFLAAIPLALWAITLAVRERRQPRTSRAVLLALVALTCFYTHVLPFAFLGLGVAFVSLGDGLRNTAQRTLPLLPAGLGVCWWSLASPAGRATVDAARGEGSGPQPSFQSWKRALEDTPNWMTDVFRDEQDLELLWAWCGCIALSILLAIVTSPRDAGPDRLGRSMTLRLALLSPLAVLGYFVMPTGYDWIWPIAQRFPLLAAIFLVISLPQPGPRARSILLAALVVVSAWHFHVAGMAFAAFDREEVGDFEEALEVIPDGKRVAGLIFQRGSRYVKFSPFIHYVAYYQARKGGAVMFSFADFPQSPFRFLDHNRPPRVPPRWEWLPGRVNPAKDLAWYEYVIVRGRPGRMARDRRHYTPVFYGKHWSVFKRIER